MQLPAFGVGTNCGSGDNTIANIDMYNHNLNSNNNRITVTYPWICTGIPSGTEIIPQHRSISAAATLDTVVLTVLVL